MFKTEDVPKKKLRPKDPERKQTFRDQQMETALDREVRLFKHPVWVKK